jgi:RNA polymerase sigma-70 factor (ECF subfamily)
VRHFKHLFRQTLQLAQNQRSRFGLQRFCDNQKAAQPHAADILELREIQHEVRAAFRDPLLTTSLKRARVCGIHAPADFQYYRWFKLGRFDIHAAEFEARAAGCAPIQCDMGCDVTLPPLDFSEADLEALRPKLRFKVCYRVGFACPDVDDIVQETITRLLLSSRNGKLERLDSVGAYLNGICQNVILEYRRRWARDGSDPSDAPEPANPQLPETELFEMREAIALGLRELSDRDRQVLRAFYLEERPKSEILAMTGLSDENFRVVLCRAKERFRQIYRAAVKHQAASHQ